MNISKQRLSEIKNIKDSDIDYSDIPELDDNFWKNAVLVEKPHKELISLRLDEDVIGYFRSQGKGYQTRINQILKTYIAAKK